MWQPDGWGWRARIGVLTPHADIGPEAEFQAMAPVGVSVHAARVPLGAMAPGGAMAATVALPAVRTFADPPHVDAAAARLAAAPLHAIAFAFTSSSYVRGADDDVALPARLEERTRRMPVVITAPAAVRALPAVGAQRLALIDPPWFSAELTQLGVQYFARQGFAVVHAGPAGLPRGQYLVHPGQLYEWARHHVPPRAAAVFVGGNGFRAIGVIQALEEDLGRPVLTANQVAFWQALQRTGTRGRHRLRNAVRTPAHRTLGPAGVALPPPDGLRRGAPARRTLHRDRLTNPRTETTERRLEDLPF